MIEVAGSAAVPAIRGDRRLALAIGNFDGVHRGHQALLRAVSARARAHDAIPAVLTFTPHPAKLFAPDRAPPLIMSLTRRLELCAAMGIELAIVEPFTPAFAAIEADAFVRDVLARDIGVRDVVVGYDFSFGRGRAGDASRLRTLGSALAIDVEVVPPVAIDGQPCSSTAIRALVAQGRTADAAPLLGRPFELQGRVVRGAARGKTLGFPTANVLPDSELLPKLGIYAARATILDGPLGGTTRSAAVSVGKNTTFTDADAVSVEAYLLDFDGDLYDRRLRLEIGERLRDEQRFDSIDALIAQISADVARVRALWS
jgi:riboflavin kinase/FMN adenylyltransferase